MAWFLITFFFPKVWHQQEDKQGQGREKVRILREKELFYFDLEHILIYTVITQTQPSR